MADEILFAGLANHRTAEALNAEYLMLGADRNALPNHPALFYAGDLHGFPTATKKIPHASIMGRDLPQPLADGATGANTAWSGDSSTVTVGRRFKAYAPSDLAKWTDTLGLIQPQTLASDAFLSSVLALTRDIAQVVGGFSEVVGSSGVSLSLANVLAALTALEIGYQGAIGEGQAMSVVHTRQWGDLRSVFAQIQGTLEHKITDEEIALRGNGYRGRRFGVDWFASGYVPLANAGVDRAGGMFVYGGVAYADMSVVAEGPDQLAIGGKVLFERARQAYDGVTGYPSHTYNGVARAIDDFGVSIVSSAT